MKDGCAGVTNTAWGDSEGWDGILYHVTTVVSVEKNVHLVKEITRLERKLIGPSPVVINNSNTQEQFLSSLLKKKSI